jgi:hypothetical protein
MKHHISECAMFNLKLTRSTSREQAMRAYRAVAFGLAVFLVAAFLVEPRGAAAATSPTQRCTQQCGDLYARCIRAKGLRPGSFNPVCASDLNRCRGRCPKGGTPPPSAQPRSPRCVIQCKDAHQRCMVGVAAEGKKRFRSEKERQQALRGYTNDCRVAHEMCRQGCG